MWGEMLWITALPGKMTSPAQQRNDFRLEIAEAIRPVMTIDAGIATYHTSSTISDIDEVPYSLPAF